MYSFDLDQRNKVGGRARGTKVDIEGIVDSESKRVASFCSHFREAMGRSRVEDRGKSKQVL